MAKEEIQHNLSYLGKRTFGQKAADALTKFAGGWGFIILLLLFIALWIYLNLMAFIGRWDPWPFIILNLILSCLAATQAPIILMSQNRQAQRDRLKAEYDHRLNLKETKYLKQILHTLNSINKKISKK